MEAYDAGKIDLPIELRAFPSGLTDHYRPVTPEEIRQGYYLTGNAEEPKFFLPANVKVIAATQHAPAVHPAEIYSTITALLITAVLLCYFFLPHSPGRVFAMMLMLEGPSRFLLEMLRVEPPVIGLLSLSMVIGLILLPIGILLWFVFSPIKKDLPGFGMLQPA